LSRNKLKFRKSFANNTQGLILQVVRDNAPISRSGIVNMTSLDHAATSRAVNLLIQRGIITQEPFSDTTGPRRKKGLNLNPNHGYCLAIGYDSFGIEGVIFNTAYKQVCGERKNIRFAEMAKAEKIETIKNFATDFQKKKPAAFTNCLGMAIIDPGIIDEKNGVALMSSTMEHWENTPIVSILQKVFNMPVKLLNTSMAIIRAVDRIELKGLPENFIYIEYSDGIGCGLKVNGAYMAGENNLAGELGHLRVTDEQVPCGCGGFGCLEAVAALPALVKNAEESLTENSDSLLNDYKKLTGMDVLDAASKGDRLASHIVDSAFESLARAVAGLVNVINPGLLVFDSTIAKAGEEAIATLKRSLQKNILASHQQNLEIKISSLEAFLGPLGGAAAVMDECLQT